MQQTPGINKSTLPSSQEYKLASLNGEVDNYEKKLMVAVGDNIPALQNRLRLVRARIDDLKENSTEPLEIQDIETLKASIEKLNIQAIDLKFKATSYQHSALNDPALIAILADKKKVGDELYSLENELRKKQKMVNSELN